MRPWSTGRALAAAALHHPAALRPVLSMVVTLQLISTFRIFSQVYVMTNGGPGGSSSSPIYYIYSVAIVRNLFGYARQSPCCFCCHPGDDGPAALSSRERA